MLDCQGISPSDSKVTMSPNARQYIEKAKFYIESANTPRTRRIGKWFAGFLVAFGLFGYFAGPPLLKSLLLKQLSAQLHREVSIERIDVSPYTLSVKVSGVSVRAADGHETAGFDELLVNASITSLLQFGAVVDEISLRGPRVSVARLADGRYDISDLLDEWMQPSEDKPTPRFSLNNIQIDGGRIEFDDQPVGKKHTVSDLRLHLPFVSSLSYHAERLVQPHFSAVIDGSTVVLDGNAKPFSDSHESELRLDLDRFDLASLNPYLPETLPFRLKSAVLDSELKLVFREQGDQLFSLTVVGAAHLSGLDVTDAGGQALLGWKRLDVELDSVDPINRKVAVQRIALDGLDVNLAVSKSGDVNWLTTLAKLPQGKKAASAEEKPAQPLLWSLAGAELSNGVVHWRDDSGRNPVRGQIEQIAASVGSIDHRLAEPLRVIEASWHIDMGERLQVGHTRVRDVVVDSRGRRVDVGEISNEKTRARLLRNKEGRIEWLTAPLLRAAQKSEAAAGKGEAAAAPWIVAIKRVAVDDLGVRFEDASTTPSAVQNIEGFRLEAENLSTENGQKGKLSLETRINQKGTLKVSGPLQLAPFAASLQVESLAVPIVPLQPYFAQYLNATVGGGQVSSKGEVVVDSGKQGVNASYKGNLTLGDFLVVDKANSADFLKWKSLYFGGIDFRLQPLTVNVGEIALADFYSRLIVSKEGRLNLADLIRKPAAPAAAEPLPDAATAPVAAAPAAGPAPLIRIDKVTLQNGSVNFSDFFVKPNYTVSVSRLGGRINGLSSTEGTLADLELRGRYGKAAPVLVTAKLNPLAAKSFLDLKAEVSGVDLTGFSPYSGKYAGYAIEKGKLSLNVAYKLENRQLSADNHLFIDQLTFGERIDSPEATKLPVNLAISLLKNNRGEIDLNLPISGSLDDPQFSVGGLVVKVIVNLFVKAVTSPFALLGSMFGGGEELSNVAFAPGRGRPDEAATKKLEALAKAMRERDALKLEISGRADPEVDREGVKRVAIERAMRDEKRKDLQKKGADENAVREAEVSGEEYATYLQRVYKDAKFPKPRNLVGMQKDLPVEEMEKLLLANYPAGDENLQRLAERRAENVQVWLIEQGKVPPERLFLLPAKVGGDDKGKGNRVDFSLR